MELDTETTCLVCHATIATHKEGDDIVFDDEFDVASLEENFAHSDCARNDLSRNWEIC